MGLDIGYASYISGYESLLDELNEYVRDDVYKKLEDHLEKLEYDEIDRIIKAGDLYFEDDEYSKYDVEQALQMFEISKGQESPTDLSLADKYSWINDEEEFHDSRMGSYSTIHYGRMFAELLHGHCVANNIDIKKFKATKESIESIIAEQVETGNVSYTGEYFDNLCNHSDCDGFYIPTVERHSFEYGSSVKLLEELDVIFETGAINILQEIYNETLRYDSAQSMPKEVRMMKVMSDNIKWVLKKLLYHAVDSIQSDGVIVFC